MNRNHMNLKGKVARYFNMPMRLGCLLILVDVVIYLMYWPGGLVLMFFIAAYFGIIAYYYMNSRQIVMQELVSFATEYGQVQKKLLRDLRIPYAVLDESGRVLWSNSMFEHVTNTDKNYHKSITSIFPPITRSVLPSDEPQKDVELQYENNYYMVRMTKIPLDEAAENSDIIDAQSFNGNLVALCMFDETAERLALQEVDDQSLVIGLIYMDDYDEALESIEDVRRSLLIALIDRKVNKYISSIDGLCEKIEKDKYFVVMRKSALEQLKESHFDLLDDVKTVNIGNETAITVSIGIGMSGLTYAQNYEFARSAVDLALGRGGDQAIIKAPETTQYFGGKTQQIEKSTRVKARVKAQAMKEIISSKDRVFIMGHRLGDPDCFGAAIGVYRICKTLNKESHIVINEVTNSLKPIKALFDNNPEYEKDLFYTSSQALDAPADNAALVVVDVNKPSITECPELLKRVPSIIVLDHHRAGTEVIENATLSYIEAYASSACEMVSEILQYIGERVNIRQEEADAMYGGIVVDTNNFSSKTGVRTFEAAAFLRRNQADVTRVRKLFREDVQDYKAKADAVSQAEIYRDSYAISICDSSGLDSPTVVGAQAANELLNIKGVKASFVFSEYQNQIFISARSIDEVNVQLVCERLGGGGHLNIAGAQLTDMNIPEAIATLKRTIDQMIGEGEL